MEPDKIAELSFSVASAVLASVGGASVIILGTSGWIGKVVANKLLTQERAKHGRALETLRSTYSRDLETLKLSNNKEIERLRENIAEKADMRSIPPNALALGYSAAFPKVIEAFEVLWEKVLRLDEVCSNFMLCYSVVWPHEYSRFLKEKNPGSLNKQQFDSKIIDQHSKLEILRPFYGERLYLLLQTYRAFAYRQSVKIIDQVNSETVCKWDQNLDGGTDTSVNQVLSRVLTEEEIRKAIEASRECSPVSTLLATIKSKILEEMNGWILGKHLVSSTIRELRILESYLPQRRSDN